MINFLEKKNYDFLIFYILHDILIVLKYLNLKSKKIKNHWFRKFKKYLKNWKKKLIFYHATIFLEKNWRSSIFQTSCLLYRILYNISKYLNLENEKIENHWFREFKKTEVSPRIKKEMGVQLEKGSFLGNQTN